jgi:hypothetical protein
MVLNVQTGKVAMRTYSTCCVAQSLERVPGPLPMKAILDRAGSLTASATNNSFDSGTRPERWP